MRDRRARARGAAEEPSRPDLVARILGSYREMPGLLLSVTQASLLFGVGIDTTRVVLEELVTRGQLRRAHDGQYALPF